MPQPPRDPAAPPEYPDAAATAAAAAAASPYATGAVVPAAAARAAVAGLGAGTALTVAGLIEALERFARLRFASAEAFAFEEVVRTHPDLAEREVRNLIEQEQRFEQEFRRKMRERLKADLPKAFAVSDPSGRLDAIKRIFEREKRFTLMREEAMLLRALGKADALLLKRLSPEGAYWALSPHVKEHTLECLAMGEKFWPWSVIERFQPPVHHGCQCYLLGLDEAIARGLMLPDQIPDPEDAERRAKTLLKDAHDLMGELPEEDLRRWIDEAIVAWQGGGIEDLDEARGKRDQRRFAKGLVKGGQFMPERGGMSASVRDKLARLLHPESPAAGRAARRGAWRWVGGHYTRVPQDSMWERRVGGSRYTSPAGSTLVYKDGALAGEERRSPGVPTQIPQGAALVEALRERVRSAEAEEISRAVAARRSPLSPGDPASRLLALEQAGFRLEGTEPRSLGTLMRYRHKERGATLDVTYDGKSVREASFNPAPEVRLPRRELRRTPRSWIEFTQDALAWGDELAERFGADLHLPEVKVDRTLGDHSGRHAWSGEALLGSDVPASIERAAARRQAGKVLRESELREVFQSYWVAAHEVAHGVNPIDPPLFHGGHANLEEALTEELSHVLATERLEEQGQEDVLEWRQRHQSAWSVQGNYRRERAALASLLDAAGIEDPQARRDTLLSLKFSTPPESRFDRLAALLKEAHPGESIDDLADRAYATMESPGVQERPVLPFVARSPGRHQVGFAGYGRFRDGWISPDGRTLHEPGGGMRRIEHLPVPKEWRESGLTEDMTDGWAVVRYEPGQEPTNDLFNVDGSPKNFRFIDSLDRALLILRAFLGKGSPGDPSPEDPEDAAQRLSRMRNGAWEWVAGVPVKRRYDGSFGVGWKPGDASSLSPTIQSPEAAVELAMRNSARVPAPGSPGKLTAPQVLKLAAAHPDATFTVTDMAGNEHSGVQIAAGIAQPAGGGWGAVGAMAGVKQPARKGHVWMNQQGKGWKQQPVSVMADVAVEPDAPASPGDPIHEAAMSHVNKAREGLDLADPDDRAIFRTRLVGSYEPVTLSGIRAHAAALGVTVPGSSRDAAVRALADAIIASPPSPASPGVPQDYAWLTPAKNGRDALDRIAYPSLEDSSAGAMSQLAQQALEDPDLTARQRAALESIANPLLMDNVPGVMTQTARHALGLPIVSPMSPGVPEQEGLPVAPASPGLPDKLKKLLDFGGGLGDEDELLMDLFAATEQPKKSKPKPYIPKDPLLGKKIGGGDTSGVDQSIPDYNAQVLELGKGAGGSNGARWAFDEDGGRWLVKTYRGNKDRVATEVLANAVYRHMGAAAAEAGTIDVPTGAPDFSGVADVPLDEPDFPDEGKRRSTGMLVLEDDGRVWIYEPRGGYGGYKNSFPKGGLEPDLSPQQNAHKELWEETGLRAEVVAMLGDYEGDTGITRFYVARRSGGEPTVGAETQAVHLVSFDEAEKALNRERDLMVLEDLRAAVTKGVPKASGEAPPELPEGRTVGLTYPTLEGKTRQFKPSAALGAHYMVDALLANWDFVGMTQDNVLWAPDGTPIRLDQGGTFELRAMGGTKPYGPVPSEVWTMLSKGQGKRGVVVSEDDMRAQAADIGERLSDKAIDELVGMAPFRDIPMQERIRENLKARRDWMRDFASGKVDLPRPAEGDDAREVLMGAQGFDLRPEEEDALFAYAEGMGDEINTVLRAKTLKDASKPVSKAVKALDGLMRDSQTKGDVIGWRGLKVSKGKAEDLVGKTISDASFMGLALDSDVLEDGVLIRMTVPEGSHAVYPDALGLEDFPAEPELLLARGATFRIAKAGMLEDGRVVLDATVVTHKSYPPQPSLSKSGKWQTYDTSASKPPSPGVPKGKPPKSGPTSLTDEPWWKSQLSAPSSPPKD